MWWFQAGVVLGAVGGTLFGGFAMWCIERMVRGAKRHSRRISSAEILRFSKPILRQEI